MNHADLISAIRMPDTLFMQTSGIEVGSDLLVFQKHTHKAALSLREKMFLQVAKEKADTAGTMTEPTNRLFSLPKTTLATGSRIVTNQYGKHVRKYQWLEDEAAMSQYLSALLKYDFSRFSAKAFSRAAVRTDSTRRCLFSAVSPLNGRTRADGLTRARWRVG